MTHKASFIVLLAGWLAAQSPSTPCCYCDASVPRQPDDVICLTAKEMRERVVHLEPLKPSELDKGLNLRGVVGLEVHFDPSGKVACARAKSGHPIAIAAAMKAVRKWTFRPLVLKGAEKGGCGPITIRYRLRNQGSSTELR